MRCIIAGSRDGVTYSQVKAAIAFSGWDITTVISGTARGADRLGERWAEENNIPVERFPADWDKYKNAAGHIRNAEMAKVADCLIALWDGRSPGTKSMISIMRFKAKLVFIHRID